MRLFGRLISAALIAATLSSCSTTEALTPQVDVGGGRARSSPVTQADTDRMARSRNPETYNTGVYPQGGYQTNPQNTLEAQARAMESGAASPASSGPPPQWQGQQQQAMQAPQSEPQQAQPPPYQQPRQMAPPQQSAALPPTSAPAPASGGASIRFLPIIGAPIQAVTPLSRQLGAQARASGLTIRPSTDTGTEHILKGYFSAFSDAGKVTIIYVWDVLDGSGARLHRMQGQESLPARGPDPWAAVPASTMETIAVKTIQDYVGWRRSGG